MSDKRKSNGTFKRKNLFTHFDLDVPTQDSRIISLSHTYVAMQALLSQLLYT